MAKYTKDKTGKYVLDKRIAGKRCHIRGNTCAEIDNKLKAWLAAQAAEKAKKEQSPLFEDIALKWFHSAEKQLSYTTVRMYKARMDTALDAFSGFRIDEIKPVNITHLYEKMAVNGYSSKTISHEKTVLYDIFHYYNLEYDAEYNPVYAAKLVKGKTAVERQPVPEAAVQAVMQHTDGFGIVPCLFAFTGARLGEIMALQAQDVDMSRTLYGCNGVIRIRKSVQWQGNRPAIKSPKTDAGIREIPVLDAFFPILKKALKGLRKDDYIVSREQEPLTASAYSRQWAKYCHMIGFAEDVKVPKRQGGKIYMFTEYRPTITAHQFRHLMATACVEAGIPEYVAQKILGHNSIQTTLKHYTHIREKMLAESYKELNAVYPKITQFENLSDKTKT